MEIIIKKLKTKEEAENLFEKFKPTLKNDFSNFPKEAMEVFRKRYSKNRLLSKFLAYIVSDQDHIIGFVIGDQPYAGVGYIDWIWVDPRYRKKGIGIKLLSFLEKEYKKLGSHKINLSTSHKNNLEFYKKCGFQIEGLRKKDSFKLDFYSFGKPI